MSRFQLARNQLFDENKDFDKQFPKNDVFTNGTSTACEEKCQSSSSSSIIARAKINNKTSSTSNKTKSRRLSMSNYRPPSPTHNGDNFFQNKKKQYSSPITEVKPFTFSPSPVQHYEGKYNESSSPIVDVSPLGSGCDFLKHHTSWGKENRKRRDDRVEDLTEKLVMVEESIVPKRRQLGSGWIADESEKDSIERSSSSVSSSSAEDSTPSTSSSAGEDEDDYNNQRDRDRGRGKERKERHSEQDEERQSRQSQQSQQRQQQEQEQRQQQEQEQEQQELEELQEVQRQRRLKKSNKEKKKSSKRRDKKKKRPHAPAMPRPPSPIDAINKGKQQCDQQHDQQYDQQRDRDEEKSNHEEKEQQEQPIIRPMCPADFGMSNTRGESKYENNNRSIQKKPKKVAPSVFGSKREQITMDKLQILRPFRTNQMIHCLLKRSTKGVMGKLNPTYTLHLQDEHWEPIGQIMKVQKKRRSRTPYYAFFDMTKGSVGRSNSKKSGNYLGKLRSNYGGSECTLFGPEAVPSGHVAVKFCRNKQDILSKAQGNSDPRAMRVLLPLVEAGDDDGTPPVVGTNGATMLEILQDQADFEETEQLGLNAHRRRRNPDEKKYNDGNDTYALLGNKLPVFSRGSYRLNFGGRVTLPSVKNFQLVKMSNVIEENMDVDVTKLDDVLLQFGRVGDDEFHLDFRAPMTAFQAMGIVLAQFNF